MLQQLSLQKKLLGSIALVTSFAFVGMLGFIFTNFKKTLIDEVQERANQTALHYGVQVQAEVEEALDAARTLAQTFEGAKEAGFAKREFFNASLSSTLAKSERFLGVWTGWEPNALDGLDQQYAGTTGTDATGRFIPYWNRGAGKIVLEPLADYEQSGPGDYYQVPKKSGSEAIVEPYLYKVAGKDVLITSVAVPMYLKGHFVGVAGVDIALDSLQQSLGKVRLYDTGYLSLLSGQGMYAADPDSSLIGKKTEDAEELRAVAETIHAAHPIANRGFSRVLKTEVLNVYVPVTFGKVKAPWIVVAHFPVNQAMAGVNRLASLAALFGVLGLALVLGTVYFIIRRTVQRLTAISSKLNEESGATLQVSSQVKQVSQSVSGAAVQQAAAIQETVSSLTEISATVQKASENAVRSAKLVSGSQEVANEGKGAVQSVIRAIDEISQSNQTLSVQVESSNEKIAGITKVILAIADKTKVINDIVFQTKLLSFNASVEAARAGEHGKGFAVVAEEVGNLAEMSGKSAKEIATMLQDSISAVETIVQETRSTVSHMIDNGKQKVSSSVEVANRCGQVLDQIVANASELSHAMEELVSASREQSQGISSISSAMSQLDEVTHANQTTAEETSKMANQLTGQAENVMGMVQSLEVEIMGRQAGAATKDSGPQAHDSEKSEAAPSAESESKAA